MNILGINGLGVSPSACLVQDGKLLAMAEEERFNRLKGSFGLMPTKATKFCLSYAKLKPENIDYIAFSWDAPLYMFHMPYFFVSTYLKRAPKFQFTRTSYAAFEQLLKYRPGNVKNMIASMLYNLGIKGKIPPIEFIPHHLSHAACAYYCSGFDKADILVIDGSGEDRCTTIFKGEGLEIEEMKCFKIPDSLGWFYQSITEFLGFLPNRHEGKTMALASYGKYDIEIYTKIKKMVNFYINGNYKYDASYSFLGKHIHGTIYSEKMVKLLKCLRNPKQPINEKHKNIAYAAQDILEKIAISLVKHISYTPNYNKKLCIAGGVALNCKMNGAIATQDCIEEIFVPPVPNDAGSALGAALYLSKEKGYDPRFRLEHAYWGPEFSHSEIKQVLINHGIKFMEVPAIGITVARLLSEGKIIGWFQGRMEIGPRALGARSILANPTNAQTKDALNRLKNRELWRPFAPSILHEAKDEYLPNVKDSPFMTLAFTVSKKIKQKIPAVVHVDDTTRPHIAKKDVDQKYWEMLKEFGRITGVPVVLNTSFNLNEEPIVCTPEDAIKTFSGSGMDCLALGNFLVYK